MNRESLQAVRAVFLAAIMVTSVFAAGVAFSGSAAASDHILVVDASDDSNYDTISGALSDVDDGDRIEVENGTYTNSQGLTVTTPNITLTAADGASPTLTTSPNSVSGTAAIDVQTEGVTVSGLTVERVAAGDRGSTSSYAQGIVVRSSGATIEDNDVIGDLSATSNDFDRFSGIVVLDPSNGGTTENIDIVNNDVSGFDTGVLVTTFYGESVSDLTISDTDATDNRVGFAAKVHNADGSISGVSGSGNDFTGSDQESIVFSPESYQGYTGLESIPTTAINFDGPVLVEDDDSIQTAVDVAADGAVVSVGPGTYNQSVALDTDDLTIAGSGDATVAGSGSGNGFTVTANNTTIRGVSITDFSSGVEITDDIRNLRLDGVTINESGHGFRVSTAGSIEGLRVIDSTFSKNEIGVYFAHPQPDDGNVTDVVFETTTFRKNSQKALYVETLSNATFDNLRIIGGQDGFDINLKAGNYGDITVKNSVFDGLDSEAVKFKEYDGTGGDFGGGPNYELGDVTVENVTIIDSYAAIWAYGYVKTDLNLTISESTFAGNEYHFLIDPAAIGESDLSTLIEDESLDNEFARAALVDSQSSVVYSGFERAFAEDEVAENDTVRVYNGTYEESVTIDTRNVTLTSNADAANTEIEYAGDGKTPTVDIVASNVTVDGFTIERIGGSDYSQGVAIRATDGVQVSNNVIIQSGDASQPTQGVLVTDNNGDNSSTTDTIIGGNEIRGFGHGIAISTQDTESGGISRALVDSNTIRNNVVGIKVSDFTDTNEEISALVIGNEISSNEDGIRVLDDSGVGPAGTDTRGGNANLGTFVVRGNNIVNNTNSGITHEASGDDNAIDAALNWWGSDRGPNAESANDVEGDGTSDEGLVVQDPFLTTQKENLEVDLEPGEVVDTKQFAQDVIAPADQDVTAVGFPGPTDQTIADAFGDFNGTIYEYSTENNTFEPVTNGDREIDSLDAFVITQNSNTTNEGAQVVIEYADSPDPGSPGTKTIEPGFNLIGAPALGDSYVAFNSPSDREVIYGTYGQPSDLSETALLRTEDADKNFIESTFGPEQDDPVVTPYGGYLVYTEEQRSITTYVQTGTTAAEVIDNLNQTAA